jgi:hypothetical protein
MQLSFLVYRLVGFITMINPFLMKLLGAELMLPYGFQLPFIEPFSLVGYSLNYLYCLLCAVNCVSGFSIGDVMLAIAIFPAFGCYELMMKMLEDLKDFENLCEYEEKLKREEKLKEIIQVHQMLLIFIDSLEKYYKSTIFMTLGVSIVQCVASLFALITINWYVGAVMIFTIIGETFLFCIFGSYLEIMQERFRKKLSELNWVGKSQSEQKTILFILLNIGKTKSISYMLGPLNLDTLMVVGCPFDLKR